jgi:hypothetical protein
VDGFLGPKYPGVAYEKRCHKAKYQTGDYDGVHAPAGTKLDISQARD